MRKISKRAEVRADSLDALLEEAEIDITKIKAEYLSRRIFSTGHNLEVPGLRKSSIKVTTIPSSKGLAADFVFITHFDEKYYIKDKNKANISDQDICNFLVSITRAKKKVFIVSLVNGRLPDFFGWIDPARIEATSK